MMKPNRIVISGYYGFGNTGDEAMLTAIVEALYERNPAVHITVISGDPQATKRMHGVHSVSRLHFPNIFQALLRCDLLLSGGGSLLQDVTSRRSLYYYLSIMRLARALRKKVFLYAQGIGPLHSPKARRTVCDVLNHVTAITVRDEASAQLLREIGVTRPVTVTADAVLAMHPADPGIGRLLLQRYGSGGVAPKVGVSVRYWGNDTGYLTEMARTLDELRRKTGCELIFLPMQYPEDMRAAAVVASQMREPATVLREPYTTAEMMGIIGALDLVVGIRLHALIFAALMRVPFIGISYDPKVDSFLATLGKKPICRINEICPAVLVPAAAAALAGGGLTAKERERIAELAKLSESTAEAALTLLETEE